MIDVHHGGSKLSSDQHETPMSREMSHFDDSVIFPLRFFFFFNSIRMSSGYSICTKKRDMRSMKYLYDISFKLSA